ncbi:hypothetical protein BP6252_05194 [Coleophoma cylindrospora]|uniref:2EXR domain-containing protein n=1 Tax=Coleophoma cylindrospora TaxID=1849047 RepID=A0A3D8RTK0_9HELO|nr:hypothetical protein BP6252_05194 [Coleophoma cylindrospora]
MDSECSQQNFSLFPDLPLELRLKIWRHTFHVNRIVAISIVLGGGRFSGWKSLDKPPVVLWVNSEAREEALKHYKLSFGTPLRPASIYFNPRIDTLRFGNGLGDDFRINREAWLEAGAGNYLLNVFLGTGYTPRPGIKPASNCQSVVSMIVDVDEDIYGRRVFIWNEIKDFCNLKELTILAWDEDSKSAERMDKFQSTLNITAADFRHWVVPNINVMSACSGNTWGALRRQLTSANEV